MKILYFSDRYTYNNYGTKRSIFEEVKSRGIDIIWIDTSQMNKILQLIKEHSPTMIWLASSALLLSPAVKAKIKIPIVGFGFSDPYYFKPDRFKSYDLYVTNHIGTYEKYKTTIPMHYNQTACDFRYHKVMDTPKNIDVSVIGLGTHPWFHDKQTRIKFVNKLRSETSYRILAFGAQWNSHPENHGFITGEKFLRIIGKSQIGLDVQDDWSPLAHRMFEYAACGVPVITRARPEIAMVFNDKEIITYTTYSDILSKLNHYMKHPEQLAEIGKRAHERCKRQHNINFRVDGILQFVKKHEGD